MFCNKEQKGFGTLQQGDHCRGNQGNHDGVREKSANLRKRGKSANFDRFSQYKSSTTSQVLFDEPSFCQNVISNNQEQLSEVGRSQDRVTTNLENMANLENSENLKNCQNLRENSGKFELL